MSSGTVAGIQGQPLEVTVVSCAKLKDTEWISRQDPYVCVEYASTKFRTRTCTDGGKHPVFQEKFVVPLIEGLRELTVVVWNSNTVTFDDFIGTGKVQLNKVLSQGFDDSSWPLQTKSGRHAGEIKLILHYANAKLNQQKLGSSSSHTPISYAATPAGSSYYPQQQQQPSYSNYHHPTPAPALAYPPPPASHHSSPYPPPSSYPSMPSPYPPHSSSPYPPPHSAYPPHSSSPYPPPHSAYPPPSAYPPSSYPPPATYPPHGGMYPPPPY
ncbi:protein SRC2 homolog isoform X1 [Vicia villosa]|uniref:protein SRC2 homolog isoform X1 n=1 Tax=Vicia villosa TaxID=3911 RepID=UPI00273AE35B|nr:protein SRC2 homolog isoform X1 [Vicia villosa]